MGGNLIAANIFVYLGACILIAALLPIRNLVQRLRPGKVRLSWVLLMALTLFFVAGYIAYGILFLGVSQGSTDLIVPSIFFSGSLFVYLSSILSLRTAIDIRRVTMLEQDSVTDPLTEIFNRQYMDRRLHEEFARAERFHQPLSILLIDLDNFKAINDEFGHLSGDSALVSFTKMVMNTIRAGDVVARYDGDKFMVIATNTGGPEVFEMAERIRKIAESHALDMVDEYKKHLSVRVTISIGISSYCERFKSVQAFVDCAGEMMVQAKKMGRNRTVLMDN